MGEVARLEITRAISIRQPYVELILRGVKQKEFRSLPTNIRGRVYLYASLRPADDRRAWRVVDRNVGTLPVGVIVGTLDIVDCRWDDRHSRYEYLLTDPRRIRPHRVPRNQPQPVFWRPTF